MTKKKILEQNRCFICGSLDEVEIHHIDWNPHNNDPHNKVKLCHYHHEDIHRNKGYLSMDEIRAERDKYTAVCKSEGEVEEEILQYYPRKLL